MENTFIELTIPYNYFGDYIIMTRVLHNYLDDNLEFNKTLMWDLQTALTINANGKYIN